MTEPDLPPELLERVAEILWKPTADYGETWAKTHSRTKLTYRHRAREVVTIVRTQGRAEAQAEIVALREAILEEAAKLVERRMEQRFEDYGTREPDTNATYYSGRAGETYEALDEEDEAIAAAIRALAHRKEGV